VVAGNDASNDRFRITTAVPRQPSLYYSAEWQRGHLLQPSQLTLCRSTAPPASPVWIVGVFSDERLKNIKGSLQQRLHKPYAVAAIRYQYNRDNVFVSSRKRKMSVLELSIQKVMPEA